MDKTEARTLLMEQLAQWRARSYGELASRIGESHRFEVCGPSGVWYQGDVQVWWDAEPHGDIRVIATIDDGGWRAFVPLTDDFIMRPDGTFVGE